jgi:predicted ferric reductase
MRERVSANWVGGVIWAGLVVSVVLGVVSPEPPSRIDLPLIAHVSGMVAGYGAAVMLLLMARTPLIEHAIGADRLARWHAVTGPMIIILVLTHALTALAGWASVRRIAVGDALIEILGWPGLLAATAGTAMLVLVGAVTMRWIRRRLSYEQWHLLHLLCYLGVGLGFTHQLAGPALAGNRALQICWSLLYTYTYAMLIRYRVYQPLHQMWRHRLRVEEVIHETAEVVSVVISGEHLDELRAQPGQFFRWRFMSPTMWRSAFPFSLSAPPTTDRLRITVKACGTGSRTLHNLAPGTRVLAEGPYGAMTSRQRRRPRVLLIAGGVGISPLRTLFETLDLPGRDLTLIYRAPTEADLVLRAEIDEIARRKGAQVIYLVGPSTDPRNQLNLRTLRDYAGALRDLDIYLCASPRMSASVRETLVRGGFPRGQLHEERFAF